MFNKIILVLIFILTIGFMACENSVNPVEDSEDSEEIIIVDDGSNHDNAADYIWNSSDEIPIILSGNTITVNGSGATVNGSTVTISSAGTYSFSGSLSDGQIIVNTEDEEIVRLILNGVDLSCSTNAPIYVMSAEKAMIVLADNTNNYVSDGSSYVYANSEDDEPNAAVFSKSDFTIYGDGTLTVDGNYNDGIAGKDGLIITTGTINVNAVDDGIRGKDYLIVKDGNFTVDAAGVGMKSDNDEDASFGYITIENGDINITSSDEGIEAEKDVEIALGEIDITSGGKGINGTICVTIDGGNYTINSVDDGIHSNGYVTINDGTFSISSDDDAIHADYDLVINGGDINITNSYEGIESAEGDITIDGGEIHIVSSDDGINIATRGGQYIYINDGYIYVNAGSDGVDANSSIVMTGGDLIVSGTTSTKNDALDFDGTFTMNGGFVVAAGSYSRRTESLSTSSSQNSILVIFSSEKSAGTFVHIEDQNGNELLTYSPVKSYQSVVFSSPDLTIGSTYKIYTGGSSSGTSTDGLYSGGTYTAGSLYSSFTVSSRVTTIN